MVQPAFIILPLVSASVFIAMVVLSIIILRRAYNSKIKIQGHIFNGEGQIDIVVTNERNNTNTSTFVTDRAVDTGGDSGFNGK